MTFRTITLSQIGMAAISILALAGCDMMGVETVVKNADAHSASARALGMPTAPPETEGFSSAKIDALNAEFRGMVDKQQLAGVTTLIARHGKVVSMDTYGKADLLAGADLKPDSIFRIASMTKPTIGTAMMQLWEQGKWKLDDPVSKYIPEFANLQVKKAGGGTEPMKTPMTMREIMSHTAGFGVSAVYNNAGLQSSDLQGMIDKLSKLPLETQPGTAWDYGPSVDIQGYIVQKLSGQSLDAYMQEHVFGPLGMVDTGFWQPQEKASRVVAINTYKDGKIVSNGPNRVATSKPAFLSGSGGLTSTAKDYWRFAQAMGNGGILDGHRVLKADTVKLMHTNVLNPGVKVDLYGPNMEGIDFGLDFAIVRDPKGTDTQQSVGSFYWGGAFGTWFWIDPVDDLVFVGLIQNLNGSTPGAGTPAMRAISYKLLYAALTDPKK